MIMVKKLQLSSLPHTAQWLPGLRFAVSVYQTAVFVPLHECATARHRVIKPMPAGDKAHLHKTSVCAEQESCYWPARSSQGSWTARWYFR
jgi:hypothetical protein